MELPADIKPVMVTRSNYLIEARLDLTVKQNDIIDIILSQVNDDDNLDYEVVIGDFKKCINKSKSNIYRDFQKAAKEFQNKISGFTIYNYGDNSETDMFWFKKITCKKKNGRILFTLNEEVKELFIQMKNYTNHNIIYTINLTQKYSQSIYYLLKGYYDTGYRIILIKELYEKLHCPNSYKKYSTFMNRVIIPSLLEINEKTDLNITYEPVYKGRKVEQLKFKITNKYENKKLTESIVVEHGTISHKKEHP